jgi:AraC-like DNA-binding protein
LKTSSTGPWSPIEKEVIDEIQALRALPVKSVTTRALLEKPARIVHHFILVTHGNVRLRIRTMGRELGVATRTLERAFAGEYGKTMAEFQTEVRLSFSRYMLSIFPPTKIAALAALLGYDRVQDFNRFFKKHMRESPSEWSRKERARIASEERRASNH